jgi:2-aminoethylphosphonate-pyruvate transaminase
MGSTNAMPSWKDKALFTPGPLTTSRTVKQAMLRDLGSRDQEFIKIVRDVRQMLVGLGEASEEQFTTILVQGSGTFGIESVLSSVVPPTGKLLVLVNGAYGERMVKIATVQHIPVLTQIVAENCPVDIDLLESALASNESISHVAVVHCETTTGIVNPIAEIGAIVKKYKRVYIVDAMSSFGAYPINLVEIGIDFLISSANKCIEGVPGFSFVLANKRALLAAKGNARSLVLDLFAQWEGLEGDGQFRFTPPVHAILAFHQALCELRDEGGIPARASRYYLNYELTMEGMTRLGFQAYVPTQHRGYTITSFLYPDHPNFSFRLFYEKLSDKGCVIYPGKLSHANCFRIGHIGRLSQADVHWLVAVVRDTLLEMQVTHLS